MKNQKTCVFIQKERIKGKKMSVFIQKEGKKNNSVFVPKMKERINEKRNNDKFIHSKK